VKFIFLWGQLLKVVGYAISKEIYKNADIFTNFTDGW